MAWTKRVLVNMAFEELAKASYVYDLTADEIQSALLRMDSMMATWEGFGIRVGYAMTLDPLAADPDQDSGLPQIANQAVFMNLAVNMAASIGKNLPQSTIALAKQGFDALQNWCMSNPPQMQYRGNLPIGAGWKRRDACGGPFVSPPQDLLTTGPDGLLEMNGPVPV